jgi:hypothetical protein
MFPTNRGICFSLKDNSNGLKTFDSCTVRAQSFSLQGIIRRAERSAVAAIESPEDFANIFNSGSHIVFCFWGVYFLRYVRLCFSTARSAGWPHTAEVFHYVLGPNVFCRPHGILHLPGHRSIGAAKPGTSGSAMRSGRDCPGITSPSCAGCIISTQTPLN